MILGEGGENEDATKFLSESDKYRVSYTSRSSVSFVRWPATWRQADVSWRQGWRDNYPKDCRFRPSVRMKGVRLQSCHEHDDTRQIKKENCGTDIACSRVCRCVHISKYPESEDCMCPIMIDRSRLRFTVKSRRSSIILRSVYKARVLRIYLLVTWKSKVQSIRQKSSDQEVKFRTFRVIARLDGDTAEQESRRSLFTG